ncbi:MAG TPA: hypothetical protein VD861_01880, partial [Pyrinomonadaceae bacterium]|nr:hypothetical protein [Pyrinomonadaceae bacterium]
TNSYVDTHVTNGVTYWYLVSPNYETWEPMPALPESSLSRMGYATGGRRRRRVYGISRGEQVEAVPAEGTPYSRSVVGHEHRPKTPSNN